jgi:hypothetical protein
MLIYSWKHTLDPEDQPNIKKCNYIPENGVNRSLVLHGREFTKMLSNLLIKFDSRNEEKLMLYELIMKIIRIIALSFTDRILYPQHYQIII